MKGYWEERGKENFGRMGIWRRFECWRGRRDVNLNWMLEVQFCNFLFSEIYQFSLFAFDSMCFCTLFYLKRKKVLKLSFKDLARLQDWELMFSVFQKKIIRKENNKIIKLQDKIIILEFFFKRKSSKDNLRFIFLQENMKKIF